MLGNRNMKTLYKIAALLLVLVFACCSCSGQTAKSPEGQPDVAVTAAPSGTDSTDASEGTSATVTGDIAGADDAAGTGDIADTGDAAGAGDATGDIADTDDAVGSDDTADTGDAAGDISYVFTPVTGDFSGLAASVSNFSVMSAKGPVSLIYLMNWTDNSGDSPKDYEFCLTGLLSKPSDSKLVEMINSFTAGEKYIYTEDAKIIDAEKRYGISFAELGYPVSNHDLFNRANLYERLGDSELCWAASTANMLINSGWADKAVNPSTGDYFKTSDEILDYFMVSFSNGGNDQKNGANWFVSGDFVRENASDAECLDGTGALLPEHASDDNVIWDTIEEEEDTALISALLTGCEKLKEGYSLGTNIWINAQSTCLDGVLEHGINYDLVSDEYYMVDWMAETEIEYDTIEDYYMTYAYDENRHRVPVTLSDGIYKDSEGNTYVESDVYENYLFYDEEQERYIPIILGNFGYSAEKRNYIDASRVSFDGDYYYSGGHAMTCMGYIINKNATDDFEKIEALIIANSDDDDNELYPFRDENAREYRPDKYTLYPTHCDTLCPNTEGSRLIALDGFKEHNTVYIYQTFSMKPFK